ncbi:MAG: PIN domain-containing protein [Stellaceae bacterium]
MTLALDTNVIVDLVRGREPLVRGRYVQALIRTEPVVISLIVLHELHLGCELHHDPHAELTRVSATLADIPIEPLDQDDVIVAAQIRARLSRRGLPVGNFDSLIAGQALKRGWTLVTANTREFGRIDGLNVIDWTTGPE